MHIMPDRFNTDILLPNGLCITLPCKREDTLETVKRQLWKTIKMTTAKYFQIGDQSSFIFSAITLDAKLEEFYEESRRLCDLRLFDLMLKLIEPEGNKEEKRISSMIDLAIGKKINELFIELPREIREEVGDFRKSNRDYEEALLAQVDQGLIFSSYSHYVDVPYKLKIISATYVNVKNVDSIFVRAALFHGNECLGVQDTTHVEPSNPKWDQWLKFDFHCTEIPQSAKICLSVCISRGKRTKEVCSLGAVNISVFDHRGVMRSGRTQLNLWQTPKNTDDLLFPFMTLGSNPNNDSPCLSLELLSFDRFVVFAPIHDIYTFAAHQIKLEPTIDHESIQIPTYPAASNSSSNAGSSTNCHTHYSSIRLDFRDRTLSNSCADTRAFIERRLSSSSNNRRDSISTTYIDNFSSIRSRRPTSSSEKFSAPSSRTSSTASMLTRSDLNGPSTKYAQNLPSLTNNITGNTLTNNSPAISNSSVSASQAASISPIASPSIPHLVSGGTKSQTPDSSIVNPYSPIEGSAVASETYSLASGPALGLSGTEEERIADVNRLIAMPPFTALSTSHKNFLWSMRFYCKRVPESLPRLLDAIDWKSRVQTSQLYVLLDEWGQVSLETALRLLHTKYEDKYVRQHAVKWLNGCLDDEMLSCYLLQFVQVLKTEPYIESELSRFLNNRALSNPSIGNLYFWYLKSECDEVNDYHNTIRFRYVLERYLRGLSENRLSTLVRQVQGLDKLMNLAEALRDKSKEDRVKFMHTQMQRVDFMEMLQDIPDPVNNNRFLGQLLYEECRIMDSAKRPLWLVWTLPIITDEHESELYPANPRSEEDVEKLLPRIQNSRRSHSYSGGKDLSSRDAKPVSNSIKEEDSTTSLSYYNTEKGSRFNTRTMTSSSDSAKGCLTAKKAIETSEVNVLTATSGKPTVATSAIIFKIGDDLRQDMLTLQVIKIVDSIWKQEGLDMCMLVYTCLSTGKNVGIIEVVNRAETITSIQKSGGRMSTIQIDSSQLHRWIKERNHDNYDEAIDRFTKSCAGYSVLTFVLGIADRNPDNIMVSEDGRIFHIDFGHFLGHFKRKFGINRERVPFVLTEDFLHVIARGSDVRRGGSFDSFRTLCGDAYISLRRHTNLLITLFEMMLKTGIPELKTVEDMSWLTTSLQIGVTEEKAREYFQAQFFEAYCGAWATKVDWFFHNIKRM